MKTHEQALFEDAPVWRAVTSLVVPTVISQVISVIYNMADTFFIGQIGDRNQVAAASLCLPMFIFMTGVANLFGIGGASLIARSLGVGDRDKARRTGAFSIWTAIGVAFVYGIVILLVRPVLLPAVGADEETYEFCNQYLIWTVCIGAVPSVLNQVLAHLVRSEGHSAQASFGLALGGVLNIILDPIFIFPLGLEIAGAAMATMISNAIASVYFIILILRKGEESDICLDPRYYSVKQGIPREVVLVGIDLSSYGKDLGCHLVDAVQLACDIPGIERVRLGSLEPLMLTDRNLSILAALPKFCPQFHLSLQSGCDATLKRMNRHYDTAFYRELVARIRRQFDNPSITTDIMVGFPGETEEEFEQSLAFAREIGFAKVHVFAYSVRPGTRAARMPDQLTRQQKEQRSRRMAAVTEQSRRQFLQGQVGLEEEVLIETETLNGMQHGYTKNYTPVCVRAQEDLSGRICRVKVVEAEGDYCIGTIL